MVRLLLSGTKGYLGACVLAEALTRGMEVRTLEGRLEGIVPGSLEVEAVIHCAGALRSRATEFDRSNRVGTAALLAGIGNSAAFIQVSSRGVYAPSEASFLDEESPLGPVDGYGTSKLAAEELVRASGLPFVIFRATALWGWGMGDGGSAFPSAATAAFAQGRPVQLHCPDRLVDYLHVRSFATLLLDALAPGLHWGRVINAAGSPRSLHNLIRNLGARMEAQGRNVTLRETAGPPARAPLLATGLLHTLFPKWEQPGDGYLLDELVRETLGGPLGTS